MILIDKLDPHTKALIVEQARSFGVRTAEELIDALYRLTKAVIKERFATG